MLVTVQLVIKRIFCQLYLNKNERNCIKTFRSFSNVTTLLKSTLSLEFSPIYINLSPHSRKVLRIIKKKKLSILNSVTRILNYINSKYFFKQNNCIWIPSNKNKQAKKKPFFFQVFLPFLYVNGILVHSLDIEKKLYFFPTGTDFIFPDLECFEISANLMFPFSSPWGSF